MALYLPIFTLMAFSFNASASVAVWGGASAWTVCQGLGNQQVKDATVRSLIVACFAAAISTTVATAAALGTTRRRAFKGQTFIYVMINQPLMVPEIVTAVALMILFRDHQVWLSGHGMDHLAHGCTGSSLAHAAFCIPLPICRSAPG